MMVREKEADTTRPENGEGYVMVCSEEHDGIYGLPFLSLLKNGSYQFVDAVREGTTSYKRMLTCEKQTASLIPIQAESRRCLVRLSACQGPLSRAKVPSTSGTLPYLSNTKCTHRLFIVSKCEIRYEESQTSGT